MRKTNIITVLTLLVFVALSGAIILKYKFLWPVLLFTILSYIPAKATKR